MMGAWRALKDLVAPERYPLPDRPPPPRTLLSERSQEEHLQQLEWEISVRRYSNWHAKLMGYHQAVITMASINLVIAFAGFFTDSKAPVIASAINVSCLAVLSIFAKRIVR